MAVSYVVYFYTVGVAVLYQAAVRGGRWGGEGEGWVGWGSGDGELMRGPKMESMLFVNADWSDVHTNWENGGQSGVIRGNGP